MLLSTNDEMKVWILTSPDRFTTMMMGSVSGADIGGPPQF
jgi:hypothetical protein